MSTLERAGKHREIAFVVKPNAEQGRRMRWNFETDGGLSESGVTCHGVEAAFKAGLEAAQCAIDIAELEKMTLGKDGQKAAKR